MALHPQAAKILELVQRAGRPEYWEIGAAAAREQHELGMPVLDIEPLPVASVEDVWVPARGGPRRLRLYRPDGHRSGGGAMLWLHGGGHVVGSIECYDALCRALARRSGALVGSLDYRLAPEHRFPAATEDALDALAWLHANAAALGVDPGRLAVGGDSAGANLAAVTAIAARDAGTPGLRWQLLAYPPVAPHPDSPSHARYGEGYLLTRKNIDWFQGSYISQESDRLDWRFAPLLCEDLSGLPPSLVVLPEFDPLHDEGLAYAERLREAGNRVEVKEYPGQIHAFLNMGGWIDEAREGVERCADALREALA